jgi:hypothetical protein
MVQSLTRYDYIQLKNIKYNRNNHTTIKYELTKKGESLAACATRLS